MDQTKEGNEHIQENIHIRQASLSNNMEVDYIKVEIDVVKQDNLNLEEPINYAYRSIMPEVIPLYDVKVENDSINKNINTKVSKTEYDSQIVKDSAAYTVKTEKVDGINEDIADNEVTTKIAFVHGVKVQNNDVISQYSQNAKVNFISVCISPDEVDCVMKQEGAHKTTNADMKHDIAFIGDNYSSKDHVSATESSQRSMLRPRRVRVAKVSKDSLQGSVETRRNPEADVRLLASNKLSCDMCPYQTHSKLLLSSHLRAHAAAVSYSCSMCSYITVNKYHLTFHYKVHSVDKPYTCHVCDKTFNSKGDLNRHSRIHSGEKPFSCPICQKTFTDGTARRNHMMMHTGVKPYSCNICNRTFTQKGTLTSHLKTHSGKKPYSCDVCDKAYGYKISLKNHLRIHYGEDPYSCDICNKMYNSKTALRSHFRIHFGKRLQSCYVCNKKFKHKSVLLKHMRVHCVENPYSCEVKET